MDTRYMVVWIILAANSLAKIKFSNIKCIEIDPTYGKFEKCALKLVRRGIVSLNIHLRAAQLPLPNFWLSVALYKKASGYRPFLYNVTTDFCLFMKNTKKIPQLKIFIDALKTDTNVNHTCPYNHDIIVKDLVLDDDMFKILPLPAGDYLLKILLGVFNDWKSEISVYINFNAPAV